MTNKSRSRAKGLVLASLLLAACDGSSSPSLTTDTQSEALDGGFKIVDSNGQSLAYVYGHADPRDDSHTS